MACYDGQAPPVVIRALIDSYPDSVRKENKMGRDPLELAAMNYRRQSPYRAEVMALLRFHRPEGSPSSGPRIESSHTALFSHNPPERMFSAAAECVVCMEKSSSVAVIPCGHICLCTLCVRTITTTGRCPVDRCEVQGLYQLEGEEVRIHHSMCVGCVGVSEVLGGTPEVVQ